MKQTVAVGAACFVHRARRNPGDLWEGPQAFRASEHNICRPGRGLSVLLHPGRRRRAGGRARRLLLRAGHGVHDLQQRSEAAALLVESVRRDPDRYAAGYPHTAHGNHLDGRKPTPNHGKKFEPGHSRHIQVGNNNIWNFLPKLCQRGEAICRRAHVMSECRKNGRKRGPERRIIVNNQQICYRTGASCTFRRASYLPAISFPLCKGSTLFNFAHHRASISQAGFGSVENGILIS